MQQVVGFYMQQMVQLHGNSCHKQFIGPCSSDRTIRSVNHCMHGGARGIVLATNGDNNSQSIFLRV